MDIPICPLCAFGVHPDLRAGFVEHVDGRAIHRACLLGYNDISPELIRTTLRAMWRAGFDLSVNPHGSTARREGYIFNVRKPGVFLSDYKSFMKMIDGVSGFLSEHYPHITGEV